MLFKTFEPDPCGASPHCSRCWMKMKLLRSFQHPKRPADRVLHYHCDSCGLDDLMQEKAEPSGQWVSP
jgi:hypothetical protein